MHEKSQFTQFCKVVSNILGRLEDKYDMNFIDLDKMSLEQNSASSVLFSLREKSPYSERLRFSPYSVRMRENTDQNNSENGSVSGCSGRKLGSKLFFHILLVTDILNT